MAIATEVRRPPRIVPNGLTHDVRGDISIADLSKPAMIEMLQLVAFHRCRARIYHIGNRLECLLHVGHAQHELVYTWSPRHKFWLQTFDERFDTYCTIEEAEAHAGEYGVAEGGYPNISYD